MMGKRLDQVLAQLCPQYSRSQLQKWIKSGDVLVNNTVGKTRDKILGGEEIVVTPVLSEQTYDKPESIELDIVFEDEHLLVINKPAGLVVHPGAGNLTGTEVKREYLALVSVDVISGATIEGNIGRHPRDRKRMTVHTTGGGKTAITHYRVEQRLNHHTLLRVNLETGRTHQIRVHLSWKHMPIVGDRVYGGRPRVPSNMDEKVRERLQRMTRQSLHATQLTIVHPATGETISWHAPMPKSMQTTENIAEKSIVRIRVITNAFTLLLSCLKNKRIPIKIPIKRPSKAPQPKRVTFSKLSGSSFVYT
ncbi:Ribosomal large subunit pseudouridine synthase D [Nymphon striatum]|nr:Ribosomal large subunit pseudouridine synthase D [Nymphon striatum]